MAEELAKAYLADIMRGLRGYKRLAESAVAQLSEVELFQQIDPESNSVAIIMKHISGSMRSRFTDLLTSDGEKPGCGRDREFVQDRLTREELMSGWESAWQLLFATVEVLKPEDLLPYHTWGRTHDLASTQSRAHALCSARRADRLSGKARARPGMEGAQHSPGCIRPVPQAISTDCR